MGYTFELSNLVTIPEDIEKMKQAEKTAVRRSNRFGNIGEVWTVDGSTFKLIDVYKQKLGDVTEENAQEEGYKDLAAYKDAITSIHHGFTWDATLEVWTHEFKKIKN